MAPEDALCAVRTAKGAGFKAAEVCDIHEKEQAEVRRLADLRLENSERLLGPVPADQFL